MTKNLMTKICSKATNESSLPFNNDHVKQKSLSTHIIHLDGTNYSFRDTNYLQGSK